MKRHALAVCASPTDWSSGTPAPRPQVQRKSGNDARRHSPPESGRPHPVFTGLRRVSLQELTAHSSEETGNVGRVRFKSLCKSLSRLALLLVSGSIAVDPFAWSTQLPSLIFATVCFLAFICLHFLGAVSIRCDNTFLVRTERPASIRAFTFQTRMIHFARANDHASDPARAPPEEGPIRPKQICRTVLFRTSIEQVTRVRLLPIT
jgi:hypothetical protein